MPPLPQISCHVLYLLSIYWLRTDFLEWIQAQPTHEEATYPQKDIRLSMALSDLFMNVHVIEVVMVFSYSICISEIKLD